MLPPPPVAQWTLPWMFSRAGTPGVPNENPSKVVEYLIMETKSFLQPCVRLPKPAKSLSTSPVPSIQACMDALLAGSYGGGYLTVRSCISTCAQINSPLVQIFTMLFPLRNGDKIRTYRQGNHNIRIFPWLKRNPLNSILTRFLAFR